MNTHQIMVIVGNGFDTSVLNKYGDKITTSYDNFYRFFKYHHPDEKNNIFIEQMEKLRKEHKTNWSDFEAILSVKLQESDIDIDKLQSDLSKLQLAFSRFLNEIVNDEIIKKLSEDTSNVPDGKKSLAYYSMSEFLGDLSKEDYKRNKFQSLVDNGDYIEMLFFNFNYTSLLDNYVYLDKDSFDPIKYRTSSNNFNFYTNPNNYEGGKAKHGDPYCHLHTSLFHPHGFQNVPKSILFGTELEIDIQKNANIKPFIKSYWAQCNWNYSKFFDDTKLFIIYGCSIGESDKWWWKKIYDRISTDKAELIIYNYGSEENDSVIDKFIKNCGISTPVNDSIKNNIYVINHGSESENKIVFLQLPK